MNYSCIGLLDWSILEQLARQQWALNHRQVIAIVFFRLRYTVDANEENHLLSRRIEEGGEECHPERNVSCLGCQFHVLFFAEVEARAERGAVSTTLRFAYFRSKKI